jgi:hypothetical protein
MEALDVMEEEKMNRVMMRAKTTAVSDVGPYANE